MNFVKNFDVTRVLTNTSGVEGNNHETDSVDCSGYQGVCFVIQSGTGSSITAKLQGQLSTG